jgi:hypothetical protein
LGRAEPRSRSQFNVSPFAGFWRMTE